MIDNNDEKATFLLTDFKLIHKNSEMQFNHFMAVFYFWTTMITVPVTAGMLTYLISSDPSERGILGYLLVFIGILGIFLSAKMFDIRHSEFRYIGKINELRNYFWQKYEIEENDKLIPLGKNANLADTARKDFGLKMAITMSLVDAVVFSVGLFLLTNSLILFIFALLVIFGFNIWLYYHYVVNKLSLEIDLK